MPGGHGATGHLFGKNFAGPYTHAFVECATHFGPKAIALANDTLTNPFSFHYVERYNFRTIGLLGLIAVLEIPSCDRWVYEIKHGRVRNCNFNSMCDNAWFFGVVFLMDWGRTFVLSFFYSLQVLMGFQDFIAGLPSKGRFPPSIGSGDLLGSRPAAGSSWRGAGPGKRGGWRTKTRPPGGETMEVNQAVSLVCPTPNEQKSLRRSTYQSETGVPKRHPDAAGKPG